MHPAPTAPRTAPYTPCTPLPEGPCGSARGPRAVSVLIAIGHPVMRKVRRVKPNRFRKPCALCGFVVEAGAGLVQWNHRTERFDVLH